MKTALLFLVLGCGLMAADPVFDSNRKFLKRLNDNDRVRNDEDPLPYLVVTSAQAFKTTKENLVKSVRDSLLEKKTNIKGRFSKVGDELKKKEEIKIPEVSLKAEELKGISECTRKYCAIKLLNENERSRMEAATDKVGTFRQFLFERLTAYLKLGEIRGYEDVNSNIETLKKGYETLEFVSKRYPKTHEWVEGVLKQTKPALAPPFLDSFLTLETIHLDGDKMKPVLRIAEVFEFEEADSTIFFDLHLYSNHFFDSSLRIIEVAKYPDEKRPAIALVTDVMEVDELKKSGLIRSLFKGKMVGGIQFYQGVVLDALEKRLGH